MAVEGKPWLTPRPHVRPSWDVFFMRQAYVMAQRGSCQRKHVGAIIVREHDKRVIAGGYNGSPRGMPDCYAAGCDVRSIDGRDSCVRTLHAESNALDQVGTLTSEPHTLYTTVVPCRLCALRIIQAGIYRVVFHETYISQGTNEVSYLFAGRDPDSLALLSATATPRTRVILEWLDVPKTSVDGTYAEH